MSRMITIALAGSGNASKAFLSAAHRSDIQFTHLWGRNTVDVDKLSKKHELEVISEANTFNSADVLIIAVSDDGIHEVSKNFEAFDGLKVHLSGSTSSEQMVGTRKAAVWPIQSLNESIKTLEGVPFCYTCESAEEPIVRQIIEAYDGQGIAMDLEKRRYMHMIAVFCNNFTNFIMASANHLLPNDQGFELFFPMIQENLKNLQKVEDPWQLQTGPAKRKDKKTIEKHLEMLEHQEVAREIYTNMTRLIQKYHDQL